MAKDVAGRTITIDVGHDNVHQEKYFEVTAYNTLSASGTIALVLTTGTKKAHALFNVIASNTGVVILREGDTATLGTDLTVFNHDFSSKRTALTTAKQDPTISVAGTVKKTVPVGSNTPIKIGGELRQGAEFILKPSTKYTLIFTADNNSTRVAVSAEFYEV